MSIVIPEIMLEAAFREGFKILRENESKFDDWLGIYKETYLADEYGQATINRIKQYIKDNQIPVLQAFHDVPSKIPCITISTLNFDEAQEKAYLGDYGYTEDVDTEAQVVLENLDIIDFDSNTGWITLDVGTDLTGVTTDLLVRDDLGTQFAVLAVIDLTASKKINIGPGAALNLGPVGGKGTAQISIISNLDFYRERRLVVPVQHRLLISVHTEDAFMTKNLHYLLVYILLSEKPRLMKRGLELSTWNASDFTRDELKLPEHVYTRSLDVYLYTFFEWLDARDTLASAYGGKIRVPKDIYPRPDGDIFTVDTVEDEE